MMKKHVISFLDNMLGIVDDTVGGIIVHVPILVRRICCRFMRRDDIRSSMGSGHSLDSRCMVSGYWL